MIAAAVVVLSAVVLTRRQRVSPVVLICGVLPLGAAIALFDTIFALLRLSSAQGDELAATSVVLTASASKVFTTSLAIALGLAAGLAIVQFVRREEGVGV